MAGLSGIWRGWFETNLRGKHPFFKFYPFCISAKLHQTKLQSLQTSFENGWVRYSNYLGRLQTDISACLIGEAQCLTFYCYPLTSYFTIPYVRMFSSPLGTFPLCPWKALSSDLYLHSTAHLQTDFSYSIRAQRVYTFLSEFQPGWFASGKRITFFCQKKIFCD